MSLRCLIIDDEPLAHEVILNYMEDIPFLENAGQCYRATQALEFLSNNSVDVIFLDIRMPKLNGLDFLRTLQRKPIVIVTSAFEEHALESFELEVCDYLLKPFRFDRMLKAANRALEIYTLKKQALNHPADPIPADTGHQQQISIKVDKKFILILPAEISYLESFGNYVKVWKGDSYLLTARTLGSFEQQLSSDVFIRIHKSYIINKSFLQHLEGNEILLKNGTKLPLGKNYRQPVKQLLK
ncbi:LytR/AlgR family response regulator transcription factor [Pedobacter nutrimenti]|uniref:LytTR family two component transcriptional regulator n=1 Tax=Pedobacter nutrimenti TaxID=1241337 RepID=A0A318UKH5_9SPHI|nr:LytTR family DNA-binding domain-containing protein [Pedobacter nutrimenti]PYF76553.1 LytTR family two component transcriptional regulator [Pedobacter nutrimenti]